MVDQPSRRAVFTGYYGMSNFGDDLFGLVCSAAARRFWHSEPCLVGPTIPGGQMRYTMPTWYPTALYGASGPLGQASRLYSFLRGYHAADVLVMGGGSVIGGPSRQSFRQRLMMSARDEGKLQLAAVGVSIGPIGSAAAEDAVAEFVRRFDYIAVRDKRSYEVATRLGVAAKTHLGRDLAGLLPLVTQLAPDGSRGAERRPGRTIRLGLAPCNYKDKRSSYPVPDKRELVAALVGEAARLARSSALQVDIFSLNDHPVHGDYALSLELQERLRASGVPVQLHRYRHQSPLEVVQAIGECDAFISVRLHGAIVSYLQGVPFAIVDYHPKCNDFADEVGLAPALRIRGGSVLTTTVRDALQTMLDGNSRPTLARQLYMQQAQDIFRCAPWSLGSSAEVAPAALSRPQPVAEHPVR